VTPQRAIGCADMFSHILIPVDGSAVSMKAARAGIAFAKNAGAKVTAYHAVNPIPYGFYARGAPSDDPIKVELEQRARRAGEKHLQAVAKAAQSAGVNCHAVVEVAIPDEGIVAAARKRKCDAILNASHGLRGIKRLLLVRSPTAFWQTLIYR
jgi:nucleotide-binding universal stress UspA family protein